ncbi:hypothetical protein [Variovorax sp. dw_954]|uniref:hypothetical protein n=1 Tax=Variovorax sp. dw_954 TaxID=2720078 RepID=UPI001BD58E66|nr:hypothetical protein [Variovorax sp. dw_954]
MKSILLAGASALVLSACGSTATSPNTATPEPKAQAPATRTAANTSPCAANFSSSGSFISGKKFSTQVPLPGVSKDTAFTKAYGSLAKSGYQIVQSDKGAGVISAAQGVSFSKGGKSVPLNVVVQSEGKGSSVSFSFSITGGLSTSEDAVRDEFCRIAGDMGAKP